MPMTEAISSFTSSACLATALSLLAISLIAVFYYKNLLQSLGTSDIIFFTEKTNEDSWGQRGEPTDLSKSPRRRSGTRLLVVPSPAKAAKRQRLQGLPKDPKTPIVE
jgi:hypothetical protein